ncbi:hypothetical protein CHS0354_033068 [Potamilus streckersoni]|uniref:Uncharacterized protein n=1 Tax=Potamilus streckersoni TaxID=2493646 RepID=A0AAE0W964_9BIVA|nr:hypothetical protein CHS0354_033068 [Potamilus streckersoni]
MKKLTIDSGENKTISAQKYASNNKTKAKTLQQEIKSGKDVTMLLKFFVLKKILEVTDTDAKSN